MKVLLIAANVATSPYPVYPIGVMVLSRALQERGYEVRVFDYLQQEQSLSRLSQCVHDYLPDAIGVSIRNIDNVNSVHEQRYLDAVRAITATVKAARPVPVILGGSAFSLLPEPILAYVGGDFGITGEGERALPELLEAIAQGNPPSHRILDGGARLQGRDISPAQYDPQLLAYYTE